MPPGVNSHFVAATSVRTYKEAAESPTSLGLRNGILELGKKRQQGEVPFSLLSFFLESQLQPHLRQRLLDRYLVRGLAVHTLECVVRREPVATVARPDRHPHAELHRKARAAAAGEFG